MIIDRKALMTALKAAEMFVSTGVTYPQHSRIRLTLGDHMHQLFVEATDGYRALRVVLTVGGVDQGEFARPVFLSRVAAAGVGKALATQKQYRDIFAYTPERAGQAGAFNLQIVAGDTCDWHSDPPPGRAMPDLDRVIEHNRAALTIAQQTTSVAGPAQVAKTAAAVALFMGAATPKDAGTMSITSTGAFKWELHCPIPGVYKVIAIAST